MKKDVAKNNYPFEWLDNLVAVRLNPEQTNLKSITENEFTTIENQLSFEIWRLNNSLKAKVFGKSEKKIQALIVHFYQSLINLIKQSKQNLADSESAKAVSLNEQLIIGLEEIQREVELRYKDYLPAPRLRDAGNDRHKTCFKVLCRLSVDQLGILIKAADDTKLILSRSISLIFRSLVPFLSTEKIKNVSWMSMRKSTYQIEKSDIEGVISILEKMIKKIKEYR